MRKIQLTKGRVALIDDDDFLLVSQWKWAFDGRYAVRSQRYGDRKLGKKRRIYLHRLVSKAPLGKCVDHLNGNPLDNRKSNLLVCTQVQNQANRHKLNRNNTSGFKGVLWLKGAKRWRAVVVDNRKLIHLGQFKLIEEAVAARRSFDNMLTNRIA